jgi:hypothetical protein
MHRPNRIRHDPRSEASEVREFSMNGLIELSPEQRERIEQLLLEAENEDAESIPDCPEFWATLCEEMKQVVSSEQQSCGDDDPI